jgi:HK97 gp10 family phage protein
MQGHDRLIAKLRRLSEQRIVLDVGKALFAGGEAIQVEAQISITAGAVSGRGHVPSKPGEPPNADTHFLANNIETVQVAPLVVEVTSRAPYSAALELGTSKMEARPFMAPAARQLVPEVSKKVSAAAERAIRRIMK